MTQRTPGMMLIQGLAAVLREANRLSDRANQRVEMAKSQHGDYSKEYHDILEDAVEVDRARATFRRFAGHVGISIDAVDAMILVIDDTLDPPVDLDCFF